MIILNPTPEQQKTRDAINHRQLDNEIQKIIRKVFDRAATDMEAQSWINVARDSGYDEIADEMQVDLRGDINLN